MIASGDLRCSGLKWHNKLWLFSCLARTRFRVEAGLRVIKRSSKAAGFNNPAGRAPLIRGLRGKPLRPRQLLARSGARIGSPNSAVDLLEPVDAFNISVPGQKAAGLKADLKCRLRLLLWKSEASVARSIITLYFLTTPWTRALPRPDASLAHAR